jgi:hypothetical protein
MLNENLVSTKSIEELLKNIPEEYHDTIKNICEGLFISESLSKSVDRSYYSEEEKKKEVEFYDVIVRKGDVEHTYIDIHNKSDTISVLKVLQWIKRDLSWTDNYEEFKRDFDNGMAKRILNYDEFRKEKDPGMENAFRVLQERKAQLSKVFNREDLKGIPSLIERI